MYKVVLIMMNGRIESVVQPSVVEVEIRDYDVDEDFDVDNDNCKTDENGDRYQEILFPAEDFPEK